MTTAGKSFAAHEAVKVAAQAIAHATSGTALTHWTIVTTASLIKASFPRFTSCRGLFSEHPACINFPVGLALDFQLP